MLQIAGTFHCLQDWLSREAGQPDPNLLGYSQSVPDPRKENTQLQPPPALRGEKVRKTTMQYHYIPNRGATIKGQIILSADKEKSEHSHITIIECNGIIWNVVGPATLETLGETTS